MTKSLDKTRKLEEQVRLWFAEGYTEGEIIEVLVESRTQRQAKEIVNQALTTFAESANADNSIIKGWALESIAFCYRKLIETGDYTGAIRAAKTLVEISKD